LTGEKGAAACACGAIIKAAIKVDLIKLVLKVIGQSPVFLRRIDGSANGCLFIGFSP